VTGPWVHSPSSHASDRVDTLLFLLHPPDTKPQGRPSAQRMTTGGSGTAHRRLLPWPKEGATVVMEVIGVVVAVTLMVAR
jgi:hypothetical protein